MRPTSLLACLALALAATAPSLAHADPADGAKDPQIARLLNEKTTLKWNFSPSGRKDRYGHAEALVGAPADKVSQTMADFAHYKELHRKFQTAHVVGKEGDATDVYMRYPVRLGPFKFEFWEVMRFRPVRKQSGSYVLEGRGVRGDMKQGHTVITVKPVDATHSLLQVDILLEPKMPAPQSLVDEELRDGAGDFVNGLKDRSQGWAGSVTAL